MTSNNRIEAALDALDKATPGPWKVIYGTGDDYSEVIANFNRLFVADIETKDDATLIAAAPDLAAEVIRLRKWKDDAFSHVEISRNYLSTELKTMKDDGSGAIDQLKQLKDEADRLIAEAEGE